MSGSFKSVRWNASEHRLDLNLYSHPKEFWGERGRGMESEPMLTPKEKSLFRKFSPEECQTHNAASGRTASRTHYQQAIPAPSEGFKSSYLCIFTNESLYSATLVYELHGLREKGLCACWSYTAVLHIERFVSMVFCCFVTTCMVGLKNSHMCKNPTQKREPQRYIWEDRRRSPCTKSSNLAI